MTVTLDLLPPVEGLVFNDDGHRYYFQSANHGPLMPDSVSQVLTATGAKNMNFARWRQSLMREHGWDQGQADAWMEQHRKARAEIGTEVHNLIQHELFGEARLAASEEADAIFNVWREKFLPRIGTVLLVEQPLIHRGAFYVGTPDLLAEIDGRMTLVDWKTCQPNKARVRPEWLLQQGAYSSLIKSCYDIDVCYGMNLVLWDSDLMVQSWNRADLRHGWAMFAGYLAEHHARLASLGSHINHAALTALAPMFQ